MNQLGMALLYLGQLCRSIRLSLSNRTAKDRLRFIRRTSNVQNLMHKLCFFHVFFNITALLIGYLEVFAPVRTELTEA